MPSDHVTATLFYTLEAAIKAYRRFAQARIAQAGLDVTIDQWLVLKSVQEHPDATQRHVAALVFKDFASFTRILQLLDAKGLVRRAPNAQDARRSRLTLTPDGEAVIAALTPVIAANRRYALRSLRADDVARAQAVLAAVLTNCHAGNAHDEAPAPPRARVRARDGRTDHVARRPADGPAGAAPHGGGARGGGRQRA